MDNLLKWLRSYQKIRDTILIDDVIKYIKKHKQKNGWVDTLSRNPNKNSFYLTVLDGSICDQQTKPFVSISEFKNGVWQEDFPEIVLYWQEFPKMPKKIRKLS